MNKPSSFSDHSLSAQDSRERPVAGHQLAQVGVWRVDFVAGEMTGPAGSVRLEPKVNLLLYHLCQAAGGVVSREQLMAVIWPDVIVGDDSLARIVSKLRLALGDDAREPQYIETLSKRGYRLLADSKMLAAAAPDADGSLQSGRKLLVTALVIGVLVLLALLAIWRFSPQATSTPGHSGPASSLLAKAEDAYFQFSRADNEAAIELYQRVLGLNPDDPLAMSGLANALAQRSIRWPGPAGSDGPEYSSLGAALDAGHLQREPALSQLRRAEQLARRAVELAPDLAAAHKALGLVLSATGDFETAMQSHRRALALDPEAWGAMINIGDLLQLSGQQAQALQYFEQAYRAMSKVYQRDAVRVRPWHAEMGVLIASQHLERGDLDQAESWYRQVLTQAPLHPQATRGLAAVLRSGGDVQAADRLCAELLQRLGPEAGCR